MLSGTVPTATLQLDVYWKVIDGDTETEWVGGYQLILSSIPNGCVCL